MPGPIAASAQTIMAHALATDPEQFRVVTTPAGHTRRVSPETVALLGGLADAASTYAALQQSGHDDNAMYRGLSPAATAASVAAAAVAASGARRLLKRITGLRKIGDIAADAMGGYQAGLAAQNMEHVAGGPHGRSDDQLTRKIHIALRPR